MPTILGLDVGSNSIGWALIERAAGKLIDAGVRIFPEGVDRTTQGTEQSKNAARRTARGMRRQAARRARRKQRLERLLEAHGLWNRTQPQRSKWIAVNPYGLRSKGLDEKLSLQEFGRVLIHLNRRRGFQSNRKTDRAKGKEASEMLAEISKLEADIQARGCRTLGEYLHQIAEPERIRGRHTRRDMYQREFNLLWGKQQSFHPETLKDELRKSVYDTIFHQRPMYWRTGSIGRCSLIPNERRASMSDRAAQRCRMLQEVNNLRILRPDGELRPLSNDERTTLLEYLADSDKRKFDDIRKKLKLTNCLFNLERGGREAMQGMPIDKSMRSLFGKKNWNARDESEKTRIVREIIDVAERGADPDEERLRQRALNEWQIPADKIESLLNFDPKGRASFSAAALDRLLPHLERGLPMMTNDQSPSAMSEAGFLRPDQQVPNQRKLLPKPPYDITNPIVRQALHEVRRLVNAIIREYGRPDAIHIELARETRGGIKQRAEYSQRIRNRQRERESAANEVKSVEGNTERIPTRADIDRVLLWKEQEERCIYTGKQISFAQLLGGEVSVDHVWPYSRCLDDSRSNKVLCFRDANDEKRNRTPYEWLHTDPARYEAVLQRVGRLPVEVRYGKMMRFQAKEIELDQFINRQLNDTSYICRQIRDYIRCLGADVVCTRGDLTAEIRHQWGLNTILEPDNDPAKKSRDDHRHHAVDAIVIALTDRSLLQKLSKRKRDVSLPPPWDHFRSQVEAKVRSIWVSFRIRKRVRGQFHEETHYGRTDKPERNTGAVRPVSRRPVESKTKFVYRVPLEKLTPNQIDEIRDKRVQELVLARLRQHGIDHAAVNTIDTKVWSEPLLLTSRRGKSLKPAVIRTVRVLKEDATIQPIRDGNVCVKPGNTHHICIFERKNARGEPVWIMDPVSLLRALKRKSELAKTPQAGAIVQRVHPDYPEGKFIMSLANGEMVLVEIDDQPRLLRMSSSVSTAKKMTFVEHNDARKETARRQKGAQRIGTVAVNAFRKWKPKKVVVDVLGRLRRAND